VEYELLSKLYYRDREKFEEEYEYRTDERVGVLLGFDINDYEAFYYNTPQFLSIIPRIYQKYADFNSVCAALPGVAYAFYQKNCLIDEIIITNDIEGIHSTRREIIEIIDTNYDVTKKKRFAGLVHKYLTLLDEGNYEIELNRCDDIRQIYDDMVLDEIDEKDWPDGQFFRREIAVVVSGTQQVKHTGVYPEGKIIEYMNRLMSIAKDERIPALFRIAIVHYMFGYIHPFYDGNGRMSRFLSSYLLKKEFNPLVALRLSYSIKENKKAYYDVFDTCNSVNNRGDLTPFIVYFLDTIEKSIDSLMEKVKTGKEKLDIIGNLLKKKYGGEELTVKRKRRTLWYLAQNALFSNEYFDRNSLAHFLGVSTVTANTYIKELINEGAPIKIEKEGNKYIFIVSSDELYDFLYN